MTTTPSAFAFASTRLSNGFLHDHTGHYCGRVIKNADTLREVPPAVRHLPGHDHTRRTYRSRGGEFSLSAVGHQIRRVVA